MLKIGIDTRDLNLASTGIRTVLDELLKEFETREDLELIKLAPKNFSPPATKLQKVREHIRYFFWKEVHLPLLAYRTKCDALICNDYVVPLFSFGVKKYPVFHGVNIWDGPQKYNAVWKFYFSLLALSGARTSTGILTVSEFSKSELVEKLEFERDKIHVIYNGPKKLVESGSIDILKKYQLEESDYLLFVGVFEKRKNIPNLIRAFSKIGNDVKLVLVGQRLLKSEVDDYPDIIRLISELKLEERVIITGHVKDPELKVLYENASLFVFPSLYEGFGIPILEAYSCRVAVIASNSTAIPEVVGDDGLLFDPSNPDDIADKISQVLEEDSLRLRLIENGENRLRFFSWKQSVDRILEVIHHDINSV